MGEEATGRWVPGLIHLHSKHSDGRNTIAQLKRWAQDQSYGFMIVTDHADMIARERFDEYVDECHAATEDDFVVIPGLEISTAWALPDGQDESTAHTLALDITDTLEEFSRVGADWSSAAARRMTAESVQGILKPKQVPLAAAHQFQYAMLKWSLSEPLAGSDFRYDMAAIAAGPGVDFYYRTVLELDHEPEDMALHTGLVNRWRDAVDGGEDAEMPWAYAGSDFHCAPLGRGRFARLLSKLPFLGWASLPIEQFSHTTWIYLQGDLTKDNIVSAIRARRTCATRARRNIVAVYRVEPVPGRPDDASSGPRSATQIAVELRFPKQTTRPMYVHVYRDGVDVSGFRKTYKRGIEHLKLAWDLPEPEKPEHAYTVAISGKLVTSPIVIAHQ